MVLVLLDNGLNVIFDFTLRMAGEFDSEMICCLKECLESLKKDPCLLLAAVVGGFVIRLLMIKRIREIRSG